LTRAAALAYNGSPIHSANDVPCGAIAAQPIAIQRLGESWARFLTLPIVRYDRTLQSIPQNAEIKAVG